MSKEHKNHSLKVRYYQEGKKKNKLFNITGLNYIQAMEVIFKGLSLDQNKYAVFYRDNKDKETSVYLNNQEEFRQFIETVSSLTVELEEKADEGKPINKEGEPRKTKQKEELKREKEPEGTLGSGYEDKIKAEEEIFSKKLMMERQALFKSQISQLQKKNKDLRQQLSYSNNQLVQKTKKIGDLESKLIESRQSRQDQIRKQVQIWSEKIKSEYQKNKTAYQHEYKEKMQKKDKIIQSLKSQCNIEEKIEKTQKECFETLEREKEVMKEMINKKAKELVKGLKSKKQPQFVHLNVKCSNDKCHAGEKDIQGARYQCLECPHFNLCEECELQGQYEHSQSHPLIKIYGHTVLKVQQKKIQRQEKKKDLPNKSKQDKKANAKEKARKLREGCPQLSTGQAYLQIDKYPDKDIESLIKAHKLKDLFPKLNTEYALAYIEKYPGKNFDYIINSYLQNVAE